MKNESAFTISCDACEARQAGHCPECFVTYLCEQEPSEAIIIDAAEARAMRMLGDGGLLARLGHVQQAS